MPTERLYYNDSFLREFDACVLECVREAESADRWRVRLDRTAFYPTSGGQPFDMSTLGGATVLEVSDTGAGEILHITNQPVEAADVHGAIEGIIHGMNPGMIHGIIDWPRRFDHMQQHTAQHMLSAAFIELFGFQTVSFHLGRDISTIDLAAPSIVQRHLDEAEQRVNEIIFEDRPISVRYGTAAELVEQGIRKKVEREGIQRVIDIHNFDRQPCGGTHLTRTGQAGMLLIRKLEKQKQNFRVEFVAGFRALAAAREDLRILLCAAEQIGCGMAELPQMIAKMQEERRTAQREAKKLTERLAEVEAAELLAKAQSSGNGGYKIVSLISDDAPQSYLSLLAAKIVAREKARAILAGRSARAIVLAQSAGLEGDMGAALRELLAKFGGKGGGSTTFAQGTVAEAANLNGIVEAAHERLRTV